MAEKIYQFDGQFRFLSNFWPARVTVEGIIYPTAEHAYQALKTEPGSSERVIIAGMKNPGLVKKYGRQIKLRADWDKIKPDVMTEVVRAKFGQNPDLAEKLVATGNAILEEGNWWGDGFWGICRGKGENQLGKILMQVREEMGNGKVSYSEGL